MKANEIIWSEKETYLFNTKEFTGHYKAIMDFGRCFPATKAQAKYFVKSGICLDVLNNMDVEKIENVLNEAGLIGYYQYTKSKHWVRLLNNSDLHKALKLKYDF